MTTMNALRIAALFAFLPLSGTANAAETGGCESFAWPLATELQWMKAADGEALASGAKLDALPAKSVTLSLLPMTDVTFPVAPTSRKKPDATKTFGGVIDFAGVAKPGPHQVTVDATSWLDVVQNGRALKPTAHTGKSDCDGIRKSLRFEIGPGPFTIEFSGIATDRIKFTVRPAD